MSARVYWHGVFPNFSQQGTIVARGTVNHAIQWDDFNVVSMVPVDAVKPVGQHKHCKCGRCGDR